MNPKHTDRIAVVMPVYNDWHAFRLVVQRIDVCFADRKEKIHIIAVDDGSSESLGEDEGFEGLKSVAAVEVVRLTVNLGHQRAVAIGLVHAQEIGGFETAIVMDADGEDRPEDVARLVDASRANAEQVLFAKRSERSEGPVFQFLYKMYRLSFWLFTGRQIDFGNFCLIPGKLLERVVAIPDIWNHFPAGIICVPICKLFGRHIKIDGITYFQPHTNPHGSLFGCIQKMRNLPIGLPIRCFI